MVSSRVTFSNQTIAICVQACNIRVFKQQLKIGFQLNKLKQQSPSEKIILLAGSRVKDFNIPVNSQLLFKVYYTPSFLVLLVNATYLTVMAGPL